MNWVKQMLSESGFASFSRTATAVCVIFSCVWVTHIVWKTQALPDLSGLTLFNSAIYGLGKVNETIQKSHQADATVEQAKNAN